MLMSSFDDFPYIRLIWVVGQCIIGTENANLFFIAAWENEPG